MSKIYVDEIVSRSGNTSVLFPNGIQIASAKSLDLSGASINLSSGLGLAGQLLSSTGTGLQWTTLVNTDTTYTFGAQGLALNDVRLNLTAGGSGSGNQQIILEGTNATSISYSALSNKITVNSTNTTYNVSAVDGTTGKKIIRLTGSDATTDDVTLVAGSNINLTRAGDEITISSLLSGTVGGPNSSTDSAIVLFDGTTGSLTKNSSVTITPSGAIISPSGVANLLTFYYPTQATFPNPTDYKGAIAYSENGGDLFYATNAQWIELAKLSDIQPNTDTTYSVAAQDVTSNVKRIRLSDSNGLTDDVELETTGGISLTRSGERLVFTGRTYNISSQTGTGNTVRFRLGDSTGVNDDVIFAGADGLLVERTDENTVTFRAPTISGITSYTDAQARSAVAQALINGTSVGIDFTYDVNSQTINSIVTASGVGGGGGGVLYDFYGTNVTSNQVILNLDPSDGVTDTVEFAGAGGTTVSWDDVNKKATIISTAPVNADWNATTGLAQILNKPVIPPAYTLPIATTSVLGGIRVDGTTVTVTASGVISATPGAYVLPAATPTTLGGIKIGAGLDIDVNGVVNVTASGIGGGLVTRQDLAGTTSSLADNATAELNIVGYKSYTLLKIQTSAAAWVRVYTDDTSRDADVTRSEGQDPTAGSGVITEVRTTGAQTVLITPGVIGFNNDATPSTNIYLSVTNRSGSTTPITVTLTAIRLEA